MIPKYLTFAVALVAVASVAVVAAMELAVFSQNQQEADARGCILSSPGTTPVKEDVLNQIYRPRMPKPMAQPMRKRITKRITATTTIRLSQLFLYRLMPEHQ